MMKSMDQLVRSSHGSRQRGSDRSSAKHTFISPASPSVASSRSPSLSGNGTSMIDTDRTESPAVNLYTQLTRLLNTTALYASPKESLLPDQARFIVAHPDGLRFDNIAITPCGTLVAASAPLVDDSNEVSRGSERRGKRKQVGAGVSEVNVGKSKEVEGDGIGRSVIHFIGTYTRVSYAKLNLEWQTDGHCPIARSGCPIASIPPSTLPSSLSSTALVPSITSQPTGPISHLIFYSQGRKLLAISGLFLKVIHLTPDSRCPAVAHHLEIDASEVITSLTSTWTSVVRGFNKVGGGDNEQGGKDVRKEESKGGMEDLKEKDEAAQSGLGATEESPGEATEQWTRRVAWWGRSDTANEKWLSDKQGGSFASGEGSDARWWGDGLFDPSSSVEASIEQIGIVEHRPSLSGMVSEENGLETANRWLDVILSFKLQGTLNQATTSAGCPTPATITAHTPPIRLQIDLSTSMVQMGSITSLLNHHILDRNAARRGMFPFELFSLSHLPPDHLSIPLSSDGPSFPISHLTSKKDESLTSSKIRDEGAMRNPVVDCGGTIDAAAEITVGDGGGGILGCVVGLPNGVVVVIGVDGVLWGKVNVGREGTGQPSFVTISSSGDLVLCGCETRVHLIKCRFIRGSVSSEQSKEVDHMCNDDGEHGKVEQLNSLYNSSQSETSDSQKLARAGGMIGTTSASTSATRIRAQLSILWCYHDAVQRERYELATWSNHLPLLFPHFVVVCEELSTGNTRLYLFDGDPLLDASQAVRLKIDTTPIAAVRRAVWQRGESTCILLGGRPGRESLLFLMPRTSTRSGRWGTAEGVPMGADKGMGYGGWPGSGYVGDRIWARLCGGFNIMDQDFEADRATFLYEDAHDHHVDVETNNDLDEKIIKLKRHEKKGLLPLPVKCVEYKRPWCHATKMQSVYSFVAPKLPSSHRRLCPPQSEVCDSTCTAWSRILTSQAIKRQGDSADVSMSCGDDSEDREEGKCVNVKPEVGEDDKGMGETEWICGDEEMRRTFTEAVKWDKQRTLAPCLR
eukprot:GHVN01041191.1.p1 GENE.GHVN01041191.1~~GHVN01041191.1.p1  ORF type:complete len:1026 (-),score=207.89 GHVN01041191.1:382-3459(-)